MAWCVIDAVLATSADQHRGRHHRQQRRPHAARSPVGAAGLVDALSAEGPFTVFAPTDEAFTALANIEVTVELLAYPLLGAVLQYPL